MIRRHPVLCVVSAFYLIGVVAVVVRQDSVVALAARAVARFVSGVPTSAVEFVLNVVLFVPMGLLFALIAGKRRWFAVFVFGVVVAVWMQLAGVVWLTRPSSTGSSLFAHVLGVVIGTVLAVCLLSIGRRRTRRPRGPLTTVSQNSGS